MATTAKLGGVGAHVMARARVMPRYRELLRVEDIFRTTKSILDTRPIYHQTDEAMGKSGGGLVPTPRPLRRLVGGDDERQD